MRRSNSINSVILALIVLGTLYLMWAGFVMTEFWSNTITEVVYEETDPVRITVDEIVEKDVYIQEAPVIPVKKTGREIILLDKSGSMEDFVTELYTSNINFFTNNDVWAFDTKVSKDVAVDEIEFGGNTNLTQAINMAAEEGYDTIWLCSDLEHNTGNLELIDAVKDVNIIIYAPKPLNEEKIKNTIEALKEKRAHLKIITMS